MSEVIKFGTDGWRAIIGADFTVQNVARVSEATGLWLKQKYKNPSVEHPYFVKILLHCQLKPIQPRKFLR